MMSKNSINNYNLNPSVNTETNKKFFSLNTEPTSKVNSVKENNLSHTLTEFQINNNY